MRRALESTLARQGLQLRGVPASQLEGHLFTPGLFEGFVVFSDLGEGRHSAAVAASLCEPSVATVVLFAKHDGSLFSHPSWPRLSEICQTIEEPLVAASTLNAVLAYYWSIADMPFCPVDFEKFAASVWSLMGSQAEWELDNFLQQLDRLMVHYDEEAGAFGPSAAEEIGHTAPAAVLRPLRRLVENDDLTAGDEFVWGLAARVRQRGWSFDAAIDELHRNTQELLTSGATVFAQNSKLLWAVTALVGARRLSVSLGRSREVLTPQPDILVSALGLLCRDFHSRQSHNHEPNPFADWWREVEDILREFSECRPRRWPTQEERTIMLLASRLEEWTGIREATAWIVRLKFLLIRAARERAARELAQTDA